MRSSESTGTVYVCENFVIKLGCAVTILHELQMYEEIHKNKAIADLFPNVPLFFDDKRGYALVFDNSDKKVSLSILFKTDRILFDDIMTDVPKLIENINNAGINHGDLNLKNILYSPVTDKVSFIDLEFTTINNPAKDFEIEDIYLDSHRKNAYIQYNLTHDEIDLEDESIYS